MSLQASPFLELQKIYRALLYGQIVFAVAIIILVQTGLFKPFASESLDRLLQVITVVYAFAAVIVGVQLFRRRLETIRNNNETPREKLAQYRSASLVQWLLLEGASIFSMISYGITGNWSFLGLTVMIIAIYGGLNPFKQKVMLQLKLNDQDIAGM